MREKLQTTNTSGIKDVLKAKRSFLFKMVCLSLAMFLGMSGARAVVIPDRAGGNIYWGGKYVNIKPSRYGDYIGRMTAVDQMEVIMKDDVVTVKITGPYFFYYMHNVKHTRDAQPGDLYISSKGWKVSGTPPYTSDIFEESEGWDYVVSLENKKVYKLKFSNIVMTSALPHSNKYRAHQAWRGGYGEAVDEAEVILTDRGLSFIFSVRNMALHSEIGLHWTMKCGNDIIEGSASLPPIAIGAPAAGPVVEADPADALSSGDILPVSGESPVVPAAGPEFASGGSMGGVAWGLAGAPLFAAWPVVGGGSHDNPYVIIPHNTPDGPPGAPVPGIITPYDNPEGPGVPVPEPSCTLLLVGSLFGLVVRRRWRGSLWGSRPACPRESRD